MKRVLTATGLALLLVSAGCAKEIGDDCISNADCGADRVCDLAMPGGYCTKSPCTTNGCPDGSVCIEYEDGGTYCMKHCDGNGDCRGGSYECVEDFGDYPYCGLPFEEEPLENG